MAVTELARDLLAEVARDRDLAFHLLDLSGQVLFASSAADEQFEVRDDTVLPCRLAAGRDLLWFPITRGQVVTYFLAATLPRSQRASLEKLVLAVRTASCNFTSAPSAADSAVSTRAKGERSRFKAFKIMGSSSMQRIVFMSGSLW